MIVVLSCGQRKQSEPAPAIDFYNGKNFKHYRLTARALVDDERIFIISARYGLIHSSDVLQPYEQAMNTNAFATPERVARQAKQLRIDSKPCVYIGGDDYLPAMKKAFTSLLDLLPTHPSGYCEQARFMFQLRERLKAHES